MMQIWVISTETVTGVEEVDLVLGVVIQAEEGETTDQERCLKQFAQIVAKIVKYHLDQQQENQYIALIVLKK